MTDKQQSQRRPGRLRRTLGQLWREHSSPARLGVAVGVGVLIGCCPLYGLQTLIGLGVAMLARLNKVAVVVGTQISIPPLAPVVVFLCLQTGALLTGGSLSIEPSSLTYSDLPGLMAHFALYWAIGGLVVGSLLGLLAGLVVAGIARRRQ